jgi:hypothetical protein
VNSWEQGEIEKIARDIWLRQGCPEGRAKEHWWEAEEIFRQKWLADAEPRPPSPRPPRPRGESLGQI